MCCPLSCAVRRRAETFFHRSSLERLLRVSFSQPVQLDSAARFVRAYISRRECADTEDASHQSPMLYGTEVEKQALEGETEIDFTILTEEAAVSHSSEHVSKPMQARLRSENENDCAGRWEHSPAVVAFGKHAPSLRSSSLCVGEQWRRYQPITRLGLCLGRGWCRWLETSADRRGRPWRSRLMPLCSCATGQLVGSHCNHCSRLCECIVRAGCSHCTHQTVNQQQLMGADAAPALGNAGSGARRLCSSTTGSQLIVSTRE